MKFAHLLNMVIFRAFGAVLVGAGDRRWSQSPPEGCASVLEVGSAGLRVRARRKCSKALREASTTSPELLRELLAAISAFWMYRVSLPNQLDRPRQTSKIVWFFTIKSNSATRTGATAVILHRSRLRDLF